jgi:hypothetical protein
MKTTVVVSSSRERNSVRNSFPNNVAVLERRLMDESSAAKAENGLQQRARLHAVNHPGSEPRVDPSGCPERRNPTSIERARLHTLSRPCLAIGVGALAPTIAVPLSWASAPEELTFSPTHAPHSFSLGGGAFRPTHLAANEKGFSPEANARLTRPQT